MTQRIPEETIEQVRNQADIVDVIGNYVQLKKQGRNYIGLCPFHGEKTPSFSVSPEKQIFHCFGCGKGGNVFSFLMEHDHLSFVESVKKAADLAHVDVTLPENVAEAEGSAPRVTSEAQKMIELNQLAAKLYHYLLMETEEGYKALQYLKERGMTEASMTEFQIGFAPNHHATVSSFLEKRGADLDLAVEAGLLTEREDGSIVDRFRSRIMFPITDDRGQLVGFSGRLIDQENGPKYLNTPETPLFNKRRLLYHFSEGRTDIRRREEVLLLEGFMDVISASDAGLANGIASMGTSLTEEHIGLVRRIANRAVISYDGDRAGIEAAYKAGLLLEEKSRMEIFVLALPGGKDPDEFIKEYGTERFLEVYLHERMTWTAYKLFYLRKQRNLQNDSERLQYMDEALTEIGKLSQAVERELYLKQLADEFEISIPALKEQLQQKIVEQKSMPNRAPSEEDFLLDLAPPPDDFYGGLVGTQPVRQTLQAYHASEYLLMKAMIGSEEAFSAIHQLLDGLNFQHDEFQALYTHLMAYYLDGNAADPNRFMDYLTDPTLKNLISELVMLETPEEATTEEYLDYINSLKKQILLDRIKQKEAEASEKDRLGDHDAAKQALAEFISLRQKLAKGDYEL
ncbi:DNA primase [Listeria kieliensis]